MKLLAAVAVGLLVLVTAFAFLNWAALGTLVDLNFGVVRGSAPLGYGLLGAGALLTAVLVAILVGQQATMLAHARRSARELRDQRLVAERTEERLNELRAHFDAALAPLQGRVVTDRGVGPDLERFQETIDARISELANTVLAQLAEMEDKLDALAAPRAFSSGHASPND